MLSTSQSNLNSKPATSIVKPISFLSSINYKSVRNVKPVLPNCNVKSVLPVCNVKPVLPDYNVTSVLPVCNVKSVQSVNNLRISRSPLMNNSSSSKSHLIKSSSIPCLPVVHVFFQYIRASALLDTGSTQNYININLANYLVSLGLGSLMDSISYAQLADGSICKSMSSLSIVVKISTFTWKLKFHILKSISYPVIIGYKSLRHMGANVNCNNNTLTFNFNASIVVPFVPLPSPNTVPLIGHITEVDPSKEFFDRLLQEFPEVLTEELGQAVNYQYSVQLTDNVPVRKAPYPLAPPQAKIMREHINDLLAKKIISPSKSAYASPAFLVKKANGGFRLCVDYRQLNKKVVMDSFPVPSIEHIFQCLKNAKVFSTLDLNSAFYQVELSEESKNITSFVTPEGQFKFHKTPFGLSVSPSALNRLMFDIFADLRYKFVIVFFDDLLIYSPDMDSHLVHVKETLRRLRAANLTVNPKKINFAQSELKFLGHHVSSSGLSMDPDKIEVIKNLSPPKNVKQLHTFIGMVGYYAKFIPNYAKIMAPLNDLRKKNVKYHLSEVHLRSIQTLKEALVSSPVLRFPDFQRDFVLQTDASQSHIGCVLLQEFEDGMHPIQYASRRLTSAETRFSTYEQEALACIWAMEKLKSYLLHRPFLLQTDSSCLKWLIQHPRNLGRVGRWLLRISRYKFRVEHIRGKDNCTADCLSRPFSDFVIPESDICSPIYNQLNQIVEFVSPINDIRTLQDQDPDLNKIKSEIIKGIKHQNFSVRENFLVRLVGKSNQRRIVVPRVLKNEIFEQFHTSSIANHPGITKTFRLISRRFWWPNMFTEVKDFVKKCEFCLRNKPNQHPDKVVMSSQIPIAVWDKIYIDLMGPLIKTHSGNKYVLLILDSYSKWLITYAIPDSCSATIIKCLHKTFTTYGSPKNIVSDNATMFSSKQFEEFCSLWGSKLIHISPYRPQSNSVERVIRNVRSALSIMLQQTFDDHLNWDLLLNHITFSNNTTYHQSIKEVPCKIFLSREIKFPVDRRWDLSAVWEQENPPSEHQLRSILQQSQDQRAKGYNKGRTLQTKFVIGDRVVQRLHYQKMRPGFHLKFLPRYSVPRIITKFTGPVSCEIQDPISGQIFKTHVEHLKKV